MKPFFLIFIFFTFAKAIYAKNIIFETSGIAKVGQDCYQFAEKVDFTVTLSSA